MNNGLGTPGERYFQDLAPSKKLAVDLGGVMFNLLTFLVLHNTFRLMPPGTAAFCHSLSLLSLVLLVLNIIPVYPLDGGAAMIHLYEWISGKTFPAKTLSVIRWVGFGVIFFFFFIWTDWIPMLIDQIVPHP